MSMFFRGSELLEIAVGIEETGFTFYSTLAGKATSGEARALYHELAEQELKHKAAFQRMLKSTGNYVPADVYTEEYDRYVKALIGGRVFTTDEEARAAAEGLESDVEALDLARGIERDAILFYSEIRNLVSEVDRGVVDWIIGQEKGHLRMLTELKLDIIEGHVS